MSFDIPTIFPVKKAEENFTDYLLKGKQPFMLDEACIPFIEFLIDIG